jgi:hypothetical protein
MRPIIGKDVSGFGRAVDRWMRMAGAVPKDRPRATGDRSPRGRIAGVDAGPYLFGDTQSVKDSSP